MRMAEEIALTHHERWDGAGYPRGLAGEDIPLSGRIVAVADVFDALVHERPYKRAWTVEEAVTEIAEQSGKQFDPEIVQAMLSLMDPANVDGHARLREIYPAKIYSEQLNAHALSITD
jgi:putative two-component system response regulator